LRLKHRLLLFFACFLIVSPALFGQGMSLTREEQIALVHPTATGELGLFTTISPDTLRQGDWSFGVYFNNYDLLAGDARDFAFPSAREYQDMSYDLYRLSATIGVGLTDRWELTAQVPYDRIKNNGDDRVGFINGFLYRGRFSDSGLGNIRLGTKIGFSPADSPSKFALLGHVEVPTGDDDGGISSGGTNLGLGLSFNGGGMGTLAAQYVFVGDRDSDDNTVDDVELPNEFRLDAGLNIPINLFPTTNWINEVNAVWYTGGDRTPDSPIFLVTGIRHWFGESGWALNAGARWNVTKFADNNDECRLTELDDCALSGLLGLTFAPMRLAVAPPPMAPVPVPPPPPPPMPAPVEPPPPPVAPPRGPVELRTDEIHFEPGSARLTNIAKAILDDVALRMKQEPTATAIVIGYTDNRENTGPNQDLDRRRAEAVRDYLVSRHGIDPSRITVEGRDAREPLGDNNTAEGRLRNRRVIIRLIIP
jgi:outer membrane protein OmpA-like peptidoglycan-associated protein